MADGGGRRPAAAQGRSRPDALQAAAQMLALRARSGHEVREALRRRGYPPDEIAAAVARLVAARYLDDAEFARTWAAARARRGVAAPGRLARELRLKGVAEEDIAAALRALRGEWDPAEAAADAARKKLKTLRGLSPDAARRRLAAWLERRGFDRDVVLAICRRQVPKTRDPDGD